MHNNLADIITGMVESECTTSGQHLLKTFALSSTSTSGARNSTSCLVDVHSIVPSKGVTTTRCIATSITAVQRQDATTSVANHCHQQKWHNKKKFTLIEEQFVDDIDDIDDIDDKFSTTFSATSSSTRAASTRRVVKTTSPTSSLTLSSTSSSSRKRAQQNSSRTNSTRSSSTTIVSGVHRQQILQREIHRQQILHRVIGDNSFQEVWGNPWCATTSVWSSCCP